MSTRHPKAADAATMNPPPRAVKPRNLDGDDPWWAIAAKQGDSTSSLVDDSTRYAGSVELARLALEQEERPTAPPEKPSEPVGRREDEFIPKEPASLEEAGLSDREVEALILKYLLNVGFGTGRQIASQVRLPFNMVGMLLARLKEEQMVVHRGSSMAGDYEYQLTDNGFSRARRYSEYCTYFGAAPVSLCDYVRAIKIQSVAEYRPGKENLARAFADLCLNREMIGQIGQAVHSGCGLFLCGKPGNGKTSIAERITLAFGETIWIPRTISVFGEIIRLFDPSNHEEMPLGSPPGALQESEIDTRWVRIRRPTIVVGGELTMENLELTTNRDTGIAEAPVQLKSNGGTLVVDDFGRQRISTTELLNRWIIPLEKHYDYLTMMSGRKVQVPFDQMIVFSTNLEPRDLVDEAFLRRIPYKIKVGDPTVEEFRELFRRSAKSCGVVFRNEMLDYLLEVHYKRAGRDMRFCHPRDILRQVSNFCQFHGRPQALTKESIDAAAKNYFAVMQGDPQ